ncbi:thiamine-phosphate synthase family protein [Candidatus Halobonum tyrrellensis]|uniref:DNA binding protein n=1 Tax=Candidatus Halobonum tyrrellensis G22 TaxID=1324957 RepID=V4J2P9_9EURY|nr:thiamine-phosphate synthase family protein [Candidatus Halobonum tyrrellensis]ESP89677.1 DNA binding protein [Candidatus Halobonum tyrrellensis G22]
MKFVEEVVVDEFLPTLRSMLAEDLRGRGLTQREVADALGISQSAVSKYAHGDVSRNRRVLEDERVADVVERVGEGLASGELSRVGALVELEVFVRELEDGDLLADLHEAAMPELADAEYDFAVHDPDSGLRERERTLASLRRGLRTLTAASGFSSLIPNVGSNLVECTSDADDIDDVAGIPGRIFDVKGRTTVPGDPEFGMSEHVAGVLLSARAAGADARAAVDVRYDAGLVDDLTAAGYDCVEFDPEAPTDAVADAVAAATPEGTFVLYQSGGFGIEPVLYVLGPDAPTVARVVRDLL